MASLGWVQKTVLLQAITLVQAVGDDGMGGEKWVGGGDRWEYKAGTSS